MQPFKQHLLQNGLSEGWQKEKMVKYIWNAKDVEDVRTSKTKVKQILKKYAIHKFKMKGKSAQHWTI